MLFFAILISFSIAGVSMAQFSDTDININTTDTTTPPEDGTTIQEEIGFIEESIEKAEDVLDELEQRVDTNTENDDEVGDESQKSDTSKILEVVDRDDNLGVEVRAQADVLKVLRERSVSRKLELKRRILEDSARASLEKKTAEKKEIEIQDDEIDIDFTIEPLEEGINIDIEKELRELETVEEKTVEELKELENIVLGKKEKIIVRTRVRRAYMEALKDSDDDGISDYDEINIYGTDPFSADSDGDGYFDGAEVLSGFDPKDSSADAIVVYENPKESGVVAENLFSVGKIEVVSKSEIGFEQATENIISVGRLSLEGKSLPNSFITLYIFSIPTVVTVKTDEDGNWNYVMDKELENGAHEVYVAMTDNSGKIITKSNPIPFVKEAFAVTVDEELLSFQIAGSKPSFFNLGYIYMTVLVLVFLIGIVLTVIGIRLRLRGEEVEDIV